MRFSNYQLSFKRQVGFWNCEGAIKQNAKQLGHSMFKIMYTVSPELDKEKVVLSFNILRETQQHIISVRKLCISYHVLTYHF